MKFLNLCMTQCCRTRPFILILPTVSGIPMQALTVIHYAKTLKNIQVGGMERMRSVQKLVCDVLNNEQTNDKEIIINEGSVRFGHFFSMHTGPEGKFASKSWPGSGAASRVKRLPYSIQNRIDYLRQYLDM